MNSLRKKFGMQFIASNSATVVYFLLSLAMSRLLKPAEIGIFSITSVLIGFTHVFRDFGVTAYIRRQKNLSDEMLRAAIGVLFSSSWLIAIALYLSAPYWALYFNQPGIRDIMRVQAIGFLFIPFGSIPQAILIREMEVRKTSIVTLVSVFIYAAACLSFAYMGLSYMSLAWANLLNIIVCSIGFMAVAPAGLPRWPSFNGWRQVAHFGTGAMLTSSLEAIDIALPDIILGKISGPHDVGIFSRGNSTVNLFNYVATPTVNYFALPYFAKTHHGGTDIARVVGQAISYLSGMMWPALIVTAFMAKDVVLLLYGASWLESAAVVPWLCLYAAVQISFTMLQPALTALNKPYLSAIPFATIVSFKIIVGVLSFDGHLTSFARAVAIAECAALPVCLYLLQTQIRLGFIDWLRCISHSVAVSILVCVQMLVLLYLLSPISQPVLRIALTALWMIPGWIAAVFLCQHPLREELFRLAATMGLKVGAHKQ